MRAVWIALVGIVVIILTPFLLPSGSGSGVSQKKIDECVAAKMSNMGHSTVGYADKMAYEKHVASKCD